MTADPFADFNTPQAPEAPADEAQTAQPDTSVWEDTTTATTSTNNTKEIATVTAASDATKVRITLKGGTAYDSPWITVDGQSIADALEQMKSNAGELKELVDVTAKIGSYFARTGGGTGGGNSGVQAAPQSNTPAPAQAAPNGETKFCKHGEMKFETKVSKKTGKPYSAFFCTGPRNDSCGIEFPGK